MKNRKKNRKFVEKKNEKKESQVIIVRYSSVPILFYLPFNFLASYLFILTHVHHHHCQQQQQHQYHPPSSSQQVSFGKCHPLRCFFF